MPPLARTFMRRAERLLHHRPTYRVVQLSENSGEEINFLYDDGGSARTYVDNLGVLRRKKSGCNACYCTICATRMYVVGTPAEYQENAITELAYFDQIQRPCWHQSRANDRRMVFCPHIWLSGNQSVFAGKALRVSAGVWHTMGAGIRIVSERRCDTNSNHGKSDWTVTREGEPVYDCHQGDLLAALEMTATRPARLDVIDTHTVPVRTSETPPQTHDLS